MEKFIHKNDDYSVIGGECKNCISDMDIPLVATIQEFLVKNIRLIHPSSALVNNIIMTGYTNLFTRHHLVEDRVLELPYRFCLLSTHPQLFKIGLTWTDPPNYYIHSSKALLNDLDLYLKLDNNTPISVNNHINNQEMIQVDISKGSIVEIIVSYTPPLTTPMQMYSLVYSNLKHIPCADPCIRYTPCIQNQTIGVLDCNSMCILPPKPTTTTTTTTTVYVEIPSIRRNLQNTSSGGIYIGVVIFLNVIILVIGFCIYPKIGAGALS